jgi:cytidylate kinase
MTDNAAEAEIRGPIAIDGPAASGKSTVARMVAERLGGHYVSTGDMYRAVTWEALRRGIDPERSPDAVVAMLADMSLEHMGARNTVPRVGINGTPVPEGELHSPAVARRVSQVAAIPEVRSWLVERQRETTRLGLVVLEGRDIGTVIFPDAPHKVFLTASPRERARRRLAQGGDVAEGATVESVAAEIAERDRRDSTRKVAPLRPADDARVIDTTEIGIAESVEQVLRHVRGETR